MQPKWISGKDILDRWKIQKIDLFRLVQDGLLPHDDLQKIKQAPDYYQKIEELKNKMKILAEYEMPRENYGDVEYDEQGNPAFAEEYQLTLKDLYSSEYESLKSDISEIETSIQNMNITDLWIEYDLPDKTDVAVPLLNDLVNSLFLFDQVESLFNDQEKSDQEDISEIPNKSSDPESGYKNKMIWNGSSWELTFEGVIIKQTFSQIGLKAIAYIIQQKGKTISPLDLTHCINYLNVNDLAKNNQELSDKNSNLNIKEKTIYISKEKLKNAELFIEEQLYLLRNDFEKRSEYEEKLQEAKKYYSVIENDDGSIKCHLISNDNTDKKNDYYSAKKSQDANIKNAIKKIRKNTNCQKIADHLDKHISNDHGKGFYYSGEIEWLIKI